MSLRHERVLYRRIQMIKLAAKTRDSASEIDVDIPNFRQPVQGEIRSATSTTLEIVLPEQDISTTDNEFL